MGFSPNKIQVLVKGNAVSVNIIELIEEMTVLNGLSAEALGEALIEKIRTRMIGRVIGYDFLHDLRREIVTEFNDWRDMGIVLFDEERYDNGEKSS